MRSAAACLALLAFGCTTQIDLVVEDETSVGLGYVEIDVTPSGPDTLAVTIGEDAAFPLRLGIRPNDDEDAEITIAVRGYRAEGTDPYVTARRGVRFEPGATRTVTIVLGDACRTVADCAPGLVCLEESCVPAPDGGLDAGTPVDGSVTSDECDSRDEDGDGRVDEDDPCVPPRTIGSGGDHTCRILGDGIECWGLNRDGQLGDGTWTSSGAAVAVGAPTTPWVDVTGGEDFTCAVDGAGAVHCWGRRDHWGAANGGAPALVSDTGEVLRLAAGDDFVCALRAERTVTCWGDNDHGQLGQGTAGPGPTSVPDLEGVRDISAGPRHVCVALVDGTARCWGDDRAGQVGGGGASRVSPIEPAALSGETVLAIGAGGRHSCAVVGAEPRPEVRCWGDATRGRTGGGQVVGVADPVELELGQDFGCARSRDDSVQCWGSNRQDALAGLPDEESDMAVSIEAVAGEAEELVAGRDHVCAHNPARTLCWGSDGSGQLGRRAELAVTAPQPVSLAGLTVTQLAAGDRTSCARGVTGGGVAEVRCWGDGRRTRLGDGAGRSSSAPVTITSLPFAPTRIFAGYRGLAIGDPNRIAAWGLASDGRLGLPGMDEFVASATTVIVGASELVQAGPAFALGHHHGCLLSSGKVWCFGLDAAGEAGGMSSEVPREISGRTDFGSVFVGRGHSCAISTTDRLLCWGDNRHGQIGQPTTVPSATMPTEVTDLGMSTVIGAGLGGRHTCAIVEGEVRCFGANGRAQLGSGTTSPVPGIVSRDLEGGYASVISAGESFTCAIASGGVTTNQLYCWGANDHGQAGGVGDPLLAPARVLSGMQTYTVAAGFDHACAKLQSGGVFCWGFDGDGAVGTGRELTSPTPMRVESP